MRCKGAFKCLASLLVVTLLGCTTFEVRDLRTTPSNGNLSGVELKARNTLPITVGVQHLRDPFKLSAAESSVQVTLFFLNLLKKSKLFDTVLYPHFQPSDVQLVLQVDFVKTFHYHSVTNECKNILLLASAFLLYPWLKICVDYLIEGRVDVEKAGKRIKSYREEGATRIYLPFISSYHKAADVLADKTMQSVSEKLLMGLLKDESLFLAHALEQVTSEQE